MLTKDIGLVLCGGGARGAFQIGAWKALEEHGILDRVGAIAGTSVGGLNAVLFALGDYGIAREIWSKVNFSNMLIPNEEIIDIFKETADKRRQGQDIGEFLLEQLESPDGLRIKGLCSPNGLVNLIKEYVPLEKLYDTDTEIFVTSLLTDENKLSYINLKKLASTDDIITALLATSALPYIYPAQKFQGHICRDGGLARFGNMPIKPLYDLGYRKIVVVSLNDRCNPAAFNISKDRKHKIIINLYKEYPGCEITVIKPLESLGGREGTVDFRQSSIQKRIIHGYLDADYMLAQKEQNSGGGNYLCVMPAPDANSVGIFIDGNNTPKPAGYRLKHYLLSRGINAYIISDKKDIPKFPGKVIIVGHNIFAKDEIKKLDLKYNEFGMEYGFNDKFCVVQARKSELKAMGAEGFGEFYYKKIAEFPDMTEKYGLPLTFEHDEKQIRRYQYDLLMPIFVKNGLGEFLKK